MSVTALVSIHVDNDDLDRFEAANPEVTKRVGDGATKYTTSHRRIRRPGMGVEIEGFASLDDVNAFWEETKDAIEEYERLLGAPCVMEVYEDVEAPTA
jgi:hypothetical protein